jgi:hypothetical protein
MLNDEITKNLLAKLQDCEDGYTERKSQGVSYEDICKTLVAFANSLREEQEGFLFIGVEDKTGDITGVDNPDKMQKKIRQLAEKKCYPPIQNYINKVIEKNGKSIVAIIIRASRNRPHFAAPAYVRRGCESVEASAELFEELIVSRNDKSHRILRERGKEVTLIESFWVSGNIWHSSSNTCKIINCDAFFVSLFDEGQRERCFPLDEILISRDPSQNRMMLIKSRA